MSVKVRVYSDLHLDHYAHLASTKGGGAFWYPPELPDDSDTILILAGDLWFGDKWITWAGFSWIDCVAPRFKQVLVVPGNHDYWAISKLSILNLAERCNKLLEDMAIFNVKVLDMSTFEIEDTIFVGATLWTDINKNDPFDMWNMPKCMEDDGKIAYETSAGGGWKRFTSEIWIAVHRKHKEYIRQVASQNEGSNIVVITHHLPLLTLSDPYYKTSSLNCYYSSDLSDVVLDNPNIKFWAYGHTHYSMESELGECRFINNSVGYRMQEKDRNKLVNHKVFEV